MDLNKWVVYDVEVLRTPDEVDGGWDNLFFSSRRRHTRSCLVSWARRCV